MNNNTTIEIKQIPESVSEIKQFYEYDTYSITCRDEYETAASYFLQLKAHLKKAEDERKLIVDPINQGLRRVNSLFKSITDPVSRIKDNLERKMRTFVDQERKKLEDEKREEAEKQKKIFEENAKKAKVEAIETGSEAALQVSQNFTRLADQVETENVKVSQTIKLGNQGTVSERRIWRFKVTDETLVPRKYLIVDEKCLRTMATQFGESGQTIPGVEFYQETSFAALK